MYNPITHIRVYYHNEHSTLTPHIHLCSTTCFGRFIGNHQVESL